MPINNEVTRFPIGLNNVRDNDLFANFGLPMRQLTFHEFGDDFDNFLATLWSVGGVGTPTRTVANTDGGAINIATSAADNDNSFLQTSVLGFTHASNKRMFFRARAQIDNATIGETVLGLQIIPAGNNILTPVNGLFFRKPDATAVMTLVNRAASVETVLASVGTVVAATDFEVAFMVENGIVTAAFNGGVIGSFTPAALPAVVMGPIAGIQNGSAASRQLRLDTIYAAKER